MKHALRRLPPILALVLIAMISAPTTAQAQNPEWVEAKLVSYDEMQLLYTLAEHMIESGKNEGARAALLASANGVQQALPRAHLPAVQTQLKRYEALAPKAYAGFEYTGDEAAFKALIAEHEPTLTDFAEKVSLPPVGKRFKNPRDRVTRVLAAKEHIPEGAKAAQAYATVAPKLEVHLQFKETKGINEAMRQIVFSALSIQDHTRLAIGAAKEQVEDFHAKVENALAKEDVLMIGSWAAKELEYGKYLELLGEEALGKKHIEHAEKAIETEREIRQKRLEANRAPKDAYQGKDSKKMRKVVKQEFSEAYPDWKIVEIRLNGDFDEVRQWVKINGETWSWRLVRRFDFAYVIYVPKGRDDGTVEVYPVRIEKQRAGGSFGNYFTYRPPYIYGYTMLKENL